MSLSSELGHEVILANHVDSQAAKARASKQGLGRVKHVVVRCMFAQDVANKKHTTLAHVNTKSNKADLMMMRRGHSASDECEGKIAYVAELSHRKDRSREMRDCDSQDMDTASTRAV